MSAELYSRKNHKNLNRQAAYLSKKYRESQSGDFFFNSHFSQLDFSKNPYFALLFLTLITQPVLSQGANIKSSDIKKASGEAAGGLNTQENNIQPFQQCPVYSPSFEWMSQKAQPAVSQAAACQSFAAFFPPQINPDEMPEKLVKEKKNKKQDKEQDKEKRENLINQILLIRCTANSSGESFNKKVFKASSYQQALIRQALISVCPEEKTLQALIDNGLTIYIINEALMQEYTGTKDFTAAYRASPAHSIVLNAHIFENTTDNEQVIIEQLVTALANEISHACINYFNLNNVSNASEDPYKILAPWKDEQGEQEFIKSFEDYLNNVADYKKLLKKSQSAGVLTNEEKNRLVSYDCALKDYITPRLGTEKHNAMQVFLTERSPSAKNENNFFKQYFKSDNTKPSFELHRDLKNSFAVSSRAEEILDYKRQNFFNELEQKRIQNKYSSHPGMYEKSSVSRLCADLLSDFETLPPQMRQTFGKNLCAYLDKYTQIETYCDRPYWKAPR